MKPEDIADMLLGRLNLPPVLNAAVRAGLVEAARLGLESADVNLKRLLMEFGNKLVGQGYDPSGPMPASLKRALKEDHSTEPITALTTWLNEHPEAQETLKGMGINWPM
jgi:hypothetical protein